MQKMLHKSFKPAKCKTALRLAIPRIKLMKNKKEAHMKQLKRELAQLLDSGEDQTARIRVEHVVREEKTVAAYNLLEIYCELIVARMPIIESQKNCPIDLKEAVSSVVFASARCEDIPELKDVCKHFTAKYGKEFTSAALELRPNCGVGRMLIEKLSVKAPDGPTKVKILTAIAEEHNIKWDPASFGAKESKIYDDMLNVPNSPTEATKFSADPPIIQVPPSHYEQRPPSVQVPNYDKGPPSVQDPKHLEKNDEPTSFSEYSSRSSPNHKNSGHSNTNVNNSMSSGTYSPNSRPLGTGNQAFRNSYSGYESAYSSPRQHWNMDFKDATTAARAAAESAELASIAARAAAELSSRGNLTQQYSMESPMSPLHCTRDAEPQEYTGSASQNEHLGRDPVNIYLHGRNSRNYKKVDSKEQHARVGDTKNVYSNTERNGDKSTHGSLKSTASSFDEEPSANNQSTDAYSQKNSSQRRQMEDFAEVSMKRNSSENVDPHNVRVREQTSYAYSHSESNTSNDHEALSNLNWQKSENDKRNSGRSRMPFVNELHDTKNSDLAEYQEVWIRKQSSHSSSHSASSTFSDDHDIGPDLNRQKSGNSSGEDSFLQKDKGSLQSSTKETTDSFNNASAIFDDYESDNHDSEDNFDFEREHGVHGFSTNFSSPGQRSTTRPSTKTNSWSNDQTVESRGKSISQSHIFSEQRDTPVFFQTSTSSAVPSHGVDLLATFDDYGPNSESEEEIEKSKFVRSTNPSIGRNEKNMDSHQAEDSIFNPQLIEVMEDTEYSNDSSLEERSMELNFGNLRGGLRHKGFRRPPYSSSPQGNALSSVEATNDASTSIKQSSPTAAVEASVSSISYNQELFSGTGSDEVNRKLSMRASSTRVDSSDDDSEEEQPKQTFSSTQDQYKKTPSVEENRRSSLRVPVPYFGSGNNDSDEDLPKTSLKSPSNTVFSRRTKASPSNSHRSSNLKATVSSETTVISDYGREKNSFIRSSNSDESLLKTQPQKKNSDHLGSFQHPQQANNSFSRSSNANESRKTQPQKKNSDHLGSFQHPQLAKNSFSRSSNADESLPKTQHQKKNSDHLENFQHPQQANNSFSRSSNSNESPKSQPQKKNSDHLGSFQHPQLAKNSFSRSSNADESLPKTQHQKKNSDHFESFQHPQLAKTSFSMSSNANESLPKTQHQKKNSDHFESFQHPQLAKTSFSMSSNANESLPKTQPQKKNSDHLGSFQHPQLSSQAKSRLVPGTKRSSSDRTIKSSETEQPSTSVSKTISSASAKSLKAQSSIGEGEPKEKASHVHPKLPDIDILTAHLNSLRQNRK